MANPIQEEGTKQLEFSPERKAYNSFALKSLYQGHDAFNVNDSDLIKYFNYLYNERPKGVAFAQDNAIGLASGLTWGLGPIARGAGIAASAAEDIYNSYRDDIWKAYQIASNNGRKTPSQEEFNAAYDSVKNYVKAGTNAAIGATLGWIVPSSRTIRKPVYFPATPERLGRTRYFSKEVFNPASPVLSETLENMMQR